MLDGDRLHVTPCARERARAIVLDPPVPWTARGLLETVNFITIALRPDPDPQAVRLLAAAAAAGAKRKAGGEYVKHAVVPLPPERWRLVPAARRAACARLRTARQPRAS